MTPNSSETNSTIRISWGSKQEILVVIGIAILTGFLLKIPSIFGLDEDYYFARENATTQGQSLSQINGLKSILN